AGRVSAPGRQRRRDNQYLPEGQHSGQGHPAGRLSDVDGPGARRCAVRAAGQPPHAGWTGGELAELGSVLVFLASRASEFIAGQALAVDGGVTIRTTTAIFVRE